jgi:aerobic carbon-monoxide dehydrogenase medium subunit
MKLAALEYTCPATLDEAIAILAAHDGDARPIAGGQSLIPILAFRLASPTVLVDLGRLPGLDGIAIGPDGVRLGAMVRWRDIERDHRLATAWPLLPAAVAHIAHYQIRNRGTVGGSLAHADPAAEMPGLAVTGDAMIEIAGSAGRRDIPARDLLVGALTTSLAADELILGIRLPPWPTLRRWAFEEFALRRGDFAVAGIALYYDEDSSRRVVDAHIGVIGVGDRPMRLNDVERELNGAPLTAATMAAAARAAAAAVTPSDDLHGSAAYRRSLVGTLLERALARASAGSR